MTERIAQGHRHGVDRAVAGDAQRLDDEGLGVGRAAVAQLPRPRCAVERVAVRDLPLEVVQRLGPRRFAGEARDR
jgi:hypothetical protein